MKRIIKWAKQCYICSDEMKLGLLIHCCICVWISRCIFGGFEWINIFRDFWKRISHSSNRSCWVSPTFPVPSKGTWNNAYKWASHVVSQISCKLEFPLKLVWYTMIILLYFRLRFDQSIVNTEFRLHLFLESYQNTANLYSLRIMNHFINIFKAQNWM